MNADDQVADPGAELPSLDLRGEVCPMTFVRSRVFLSSLEAESVARLIFDHEPARRSLPRSLEDIGCSVLESRVREDGLFEIRVRRPSDSL